MPAKAGPMSGFFLFGILLGAVLGLRLKVVSVIPATVLVVAVLIPFGIAGHHDWQSLAVRVVIITALIQFGYLSGAILRRYLAAARVERRPQWRPSDSALLIKND